ncbi:unnamed protein product [Urochloa decumbens]|uniref:Uncharacterized protein n=1 Tax=Urochloa decumbens TaxID=240449 RepID=A0ABC9E9M6_9POAL
MATRLLIQKFSEMSRSASLLGAHASVARATAAPEGVFHGTAVVPGMTARSNPVIHSYAARYFNVFPCSHADAKTSLATTGVPSTIKNGMMPGFLDFAKGLKRTFSSSASKSNRHKFTTEAEMATRQAHDAACKPKLSVSQQVKKDVDTTIALMAFTCFGILYMLSIESSSPNNGSSRCSNCCNCQCQGSNPVQQD